MNRFFIRRQNILDCAGIAIALLVCGALSHAIYFMRDTWPGLNPAPSENAAMFYGFGDRQLSYRNVGLILQNAGDTGGRVTNFKDYDYSIVEDWLWLSAKLDAKANYVPSLAAYYFSGAKEPEQLRHLLDYLEYVGTDAQDERWRWLAHAIYLARFRIKDENKAYELAKKIAALQGPDIPMWAKVMPAYVNNARGNKKEARDLLLLTIADPNLKQQEQADINQNCWYINEHLREEGDDLENNEIYKNFCLPYIATLKEPNKNK